jgi:hypothetical protein
MTWSPGGICLFTLRPAEPVLKTRDSSGAVMSQMVGAGAQVPRGGPRAVPGQEAGAGATGHVAAPELSQSEGGSHFLDLMLVRGVPDPQGTDNYFPRFKFK